MDKILKQSCASFSRGTVQISLKHKSKNLNR